MPTEFAFITDFLVCPACFKLHDAPFDVGDKCLCGTAIVDGKAVREWKLIFDMVGSVVAEARVIRAKGGHHLAVYGAIGKVLIDRDEFDAHFDMLLNDIAPWRKPNAE
jgi:hypothetical protein